MFCFGEEAKEGRDPQLCCLSNLEPFLIGVLECGLGEADRLPWNTVFVAGERSGKSLQMKESNMICSGLQGEARTLYNYLFIYLFIYSFIYLFIYLFVCRARSLLKIFCLHCNI